MFTNGIRYPEFDPDYGENNGFNHYNTGTQVFFMTIEQLIEYHDKKETKLKKQEKEENDSFINNE